MSTLPEAVGGRAERACDDDLDSPLPRPHAALSVVAVGPAEPSARAAGLRAYARTLRWPLGVYAVTRVLYLAIALINIPVQHWALTWQLSNWDGVWYINLATHGYPTVVSHGQTTLGFFPLYAIAMWLVGHALFMSYALAGVLISIVTGAVATVLVQRLATGWWGEDVGRRSVLLFCLFPGSIVFSMVYTEGLMIALAAGTILALERRRWLLAGILSAFATAIGPVALAIIPACAIASALEFRRVGWRDRSARRSLLAPLLAPLGLIAFGVFLWQWTGTPLASYAAQRYGWQETSSFLALYQTAHHFLYSSIHFFNHPSWNHPGINANYPVGLIGGIVLFLGVVQLYRLRPWISAPAVVWTLFIGLFTVTSANVPPNPRMLICAFPAVIVYARWLRGRAFNWLLVGCFGLVLLMSYVSFVGTGLRP